jgi:hypothetical protein
MFTEREERREGRQAGLYSDREFNPELLKY